MSTKIDPGPFDALEKAQPDEPIFTLAARDPLAPALVHEWVARRRAAITHSDMPEATRTLELVQCREAEEVAFAMVDWRSGLTAVEPEPATTSDRGSRMSSEELAAKAAFDTRRDAAAALNNSVAEISEAAEALGRYGWEGEKLTLLSHADCLKGIALEIRPKRASYAHLAVDNDA